MAPAPRQHPAPSAAALWRWQWRRWREGLPREPAGGYHLPVSTPDLTFLQHNRSVDAVTWIGHSTLLLQLGGMNILTDPQFSARASPLSFLGPRRRVPPIPTLDQLPAVDAVLISHNHYDHLDLKSVRQLATHPRGRPRFFVPRGLGRWFARRGIGAVTELDWWSATQLGPLRLHCVPVRHWSARTSFDRNRSAWCGWVVEMNGRRLLFAGDTGYTDLFTAIRERLGPMALAAIPIGHYEPRWFMAPSHVDPGEAIRIAQAVQSRIAIAIHWGTFPLTDEPLDEPPRRLAEELAAARLPPEYFVVLRRGETRRIDALLAAAEHRHEVD